MRHTIKSHGNFDLYKEGNCTSTIVESIALLICFGNEVVVWGCLVAVMLRLAAELLAVTKGISSSPSVDAQNLLGF